MGIDTKTIINVLIALLVFKLVEKHVLTKLPGGIFDYEGDSE